MSNAKLPHKHAELIKQWADGAKIQMRTSFGSADVGPEWLDSKTPTWNEYYQYRVKPEPRYPESTLTVDQMMSTIRETPGGYLDSYRALCNHAIKHFIESGEVIEYVTNPKNRFVLKGYI